MERPWLTEPDREEFEHAGLTCLLNRGPGGQWCGYVATLPGHPLHGKGYSSSYDDDGNYIKPTGRTVDELSVHGGITFADKCQEGGHICHTPKPGEPDDVWWLGFDCAHAGDFMPKHDDPDSEHQRRMRQSYHGWKNYRDGSVYRDIEYARAETRRLAEQLREMAS